MAKANEVLLEALKQGSLESDEQRLYRSGKLPGLFSARTSVNTQAAARALRDGFIEIVRSETRGKTPVEWVRVTPKGHDFVLQHESPARAMDQLREVLELNAQGMPQWLGEFKQQLEDIEHKFLHEVHAVSHRLEALAQRVQEAIKRAVPVDAVPAKGTPAAFSWAEDALHYLKRRTDGGVTTRCPLSELFNVMRQKVNQLSIKDFHSGLRRLHDRGSLKLLKHEDSETPPEPEYALLDGSTLFYYATL